MVADDAQHFGLVLFVAAECPALFGHLGTGGVRLAGEDGGKRCTDSTSLVAVVGDTSLHEHGAEVGVTQANGAVVIGELCDFFRGEARHQHRNFQHDRPQPDRMFVACNIEGAALGIEKAKHIERRQIACRVVEEHVLRAVVYGDAVGNEGIGCRLGQVKHLPHANVSELRHTLPMTSARRAGARHLGGHLQVPRKVAVTDADLRCKRLKTAFVYSQRVNGNSGPNAGANSKSQQ